MNYIIRGLTGMGLFLCMAFSNETGLDVQPKWKSHGLTDTTIQAAPSMPTLAGTPALLPITSTSTSSSMPASEPLSPPTNLTAQGIGNNQIRLNWTNTSTSETGFEVQSFWGSNPYATLTTAAAHVTIFTADNAPPGRPYTFQVRAIGSGGAVSAWSNSATSTSDFAGPPAGPNPVTSRWTAARAAAWYQGKNWNMGFNFVPSTACNTTEFWQASTFDLPTITRELALAHRLGYTSTRVFIQYIVWKADPAGFKNRFNQFLTVAAGNNISVVPVLFDDCSFGQPKQLDPILGKQRDLIPGMILSSWTPSPGDTIGTDVLQEANLRAYVQDMLRTYGSDSRILFWDLFNEPLAAGHVGTTSFLELIFSWAREINPSQPLTVCAYSDMNQTIFNMCDVITYHAYIPTPEMATRIAQVKNSNPGYPVVCTEWFARPLGGDLSTGLPLFKSQGVWCYQWGLVNGRTQAQFPWWNGPGGEVNPTYGWFSDIFNPDLTPYRPSEISTIEANALPH